MGDAGVVIADDYFGSGFPGVSEGTARFLLRNPDALQPFAIGDSRMFLCRPDWTERYRAVLDSSIVPRRRVAVTPMWGAWCRCTGRRDGRSIGFAGSRSRKPLSPTRWAAG